MSEKISATEKKDGTHLVAVGFFSFIESHRILLFDLGLVEVNRKAIVRLLHAQRVGRRDLRAQSQSAVCWISETKRKKKRH